MFQNYLANYFKIVVDYYTLIVCVDLLGGIKSPFQEKSPKRSYFVEKKQ